MTSATRAWYRWCPAARDARQNGSAGRRLVSLSRRVPQRGAKQNYSTQCVFLWFSSTHDRHDGLFCTPPRPRAGSSHILTTRAAPQPKEITDIRDFLQKARREDAKRIKVKKSNDATKFKIRCSRYLYTLRVADKQKAEKLISSLPPGARRPQPQFPPFSAVSRPARRPPAPRLPLTRRNFPFQASSAWRCKHASPLGSARASRAGTRQ